MKVKKHTWINGYNRVMMGDLMTITIEDYTGARLEKWTVNPKNAKEYGKVIQIIEKRYGWKPVIEIDKSVNSKERGWWDDPVPISESVTNI